MKKNMLICAPVSSRSGYGAHARDLVTSLINHDKYHIKIMDVPWGTTPRNALTEDTTINNNKIKQHLLNPGESLNQQPDIYVDIRIPNEFQTHGKFNIGITAGIETTAVSQNWIEGCNKMDLIIVPSQHSKRGFVDSIYDKVQNLPDGKQQKVGELKLEKPMEVLFEGADENVYKPLSVKEIDSKFFDWLNDEVPERFAYLHVGQWGKGNIGDDRKDIGTLIRTFYEVFANSKKQPALILKSCGATFSILDREECLSKIRQIKDMFPKGFKLPNVYLLHGSLSDEEMNYLYNHPKVKSFVTFTHGEGFGRPLLEATMTGLPVIATGWSGHLDFLNPVECLLLNGELKQVPKSAVWKDIVIEQSQWFHADPTFSRNSLKHSFENHEVAKRKAKSLMDKNRGKFTLNKMTDEFGVILEKYLKNVPQQVSLNLPKLKKVNQDKNKIKLPKLKKVGKTEATI